MEQRLVEIETKMLFQEDTIEQLNQVICKQDEQIRNMQIAMERLAKNLKNLMEMNSDIKMGHEKPPHY